MENDERKRAELVKMWNTKVACNMPSKKRIHQYKKRRQIERRDTRMFTQEEFSNIDAIIEQQKEINKFLAE